MSSIILAMPGNEALAADLATHLGAELGTFTTHEFPDGEIVVRIQTLIEHRQVIIVCSLDRVEQKLLPLIYLAATAKDLGADRVGLVAPYLAYMRQDYRFQAGEGISSRYFAKLIGLYFDWLVTVDPHLHRHFSLIGLFSIPTKVMHAAGLIAQWIEVHVERPIVIGPDAESLQWARHVADFAHAPYFVLSKHRVDDRTIEVGLPNDVFPSHGTPVLIDDIISTGGTMLATIAALKKAGFEPPVCIGVHGVFAGDAYSDLKKSGAATIVTTDSIAHETNAISVVPLLVEGVCAIDRFQEDSREYLSGIDEIIERAKL